MTKSLLYLSRIFKSSGAAPAPTASAPTSIFSSILSCFYPSQNKPSDPSVSIAFEDLRKRVDAATFAVDSPIKTASTSDDFLTLDEFNSFKEKEKKVIEKRDVKTVEEELYLKLLKNLKTPKSFILEIETRKVNYNVGELDFKSDDYKNITEFLLKKFQETKETDIISRNFKNFLTYLTRVCMDLAEERGKEEKVALQSGAPVAAKATAAAGAAVGGRAEAKDEAKAAEAAEGRRIILDNLKDFDKNSNEDNLFKDLLSKLGIDQDIDTRLKSIILTNREEIKEFLEKDKHELSKALREYILNRPYDPFDKDQQDLKKYSAIGVLTKDGGDYYKHDLETYNLAFNFLQGKLPKDEQEILTDFQKLRDQSFKSIDKKTENKDKTFQSALIKGLDEGKNLLKSPLTVINLYETVTSLQVGLVSFFALETPNFRKPNTDPKNSKIENFKSALKIEADSR